MRDTDRPMTTMQAVEGAFKCGSPSGGTGGLVIERCEPGVHVFTQQAAGLDVALARLPGPGAAILRLHTVCPYYTMFPLDFPFQALQSVRRGEWVLDPFCGRGTTTFAARLRGLPSVGVDSNPLAAAVAASKLVAPDLVEVVDIAREALSAPLRESVPAGRFWELAFHPETLAGLCKVRRRLLDQCSSEAEVFLRALMLGILHGPRQKGRPTYLSAQMPRTYATKPGPAVRYWERRGLLEPPSVDVLDVIERRAGFVLAALPPPASGAVIFGDSRSVDLRSPDGVGYSWIITSPPYFGMRTYRPDQWLRNWFLGGNPVVNYSSNGQVRHHTEQFATELGRVWRNVAGASRAGAHLVVRFGCLPCYSGNPGDLLLRSLVLSERPWRVLRVTDAGSARHGKRQAVQFGRAGDAASEIDIEAVLEG